MTDLSNLQLFTTQEHDCSYLPDQVATTLFVDPNHPIDQDLYSHLSRLGFRRSGGNIYRPYCTDCQACLPARVTVNQFNPKRGQRRCLKRNSDIEAQLTTSIDTPEHYELYARYINTRHSDGDMYPANEEQYRSFLTSEWDVTQYVNFYVNEKLCAVVVMDQLNDGLSAVYTFFDPDMQERSLGVFAILWQIENVKKQGLSYLYLGYWIKQCQKMSYKLNYRPVELFHKQRWVSVK